MEGFKENEGDKDLKILSLCAYQVRSCRGAVLLSVLRLSLTLAAGVSVMMCRFAYVSGLLLLCLASASLLVVRMLCSHPGTLNAPFASVLRVAACRKIAG